MPGRCIAMWSGPRNISTAMMRAWENRADTHVIDEPFYAHFLHKTGIDHPMREAVIGQGELDWRVIASQLSEIPVEGIYYQKHITTHWLNHFTTDWLEKIDHVFLIRDPTPVIASYSQKRSDLTAYDLGYEQQARLFNLIKEMQNKTPEVIDSQRFLNAPEAHLKALCKSLDIPFDYAMLSWPAGPRQTDGIWGKHWYDAVVKSTEFSAPRSAAVSLNAWQSAIAESCETYYRSMLEHAL